jgi:hypothetical protein
MSEKIKVYVDTNIPNHILEDTRNAFSERQAEALAKLTEIPNITFVVSDKVKQELLNVKDEKRKNLLVFLFHLFEEGVTYSETFPYSGLFGDAPLGTVLLGGDSDTYEPALLTFIKKAYNNKVGDTDINHVYQAVQNSCRFFLTDDGPLLKAARIFKEELIKGGVNVYFCEPQELYELLNSK